MIKLVGGSFLALLQLGARLSNSAYYADFSNYTGQVLYSSTTCEIEKPVFFVYIQDNSLYIVTRGSQDDEDFATDAEFTETVTDYGVFHTGFYNAAVYVYEHTKEYINSWNGPVYFVGHSYGAAVSQILTVMSYHFKNDIDAYSFAYAPMPAMDITADDKIQDRLYAIVNDDDIIPTLSVPNVYEKFHLLYPTIRYVPTDILVGTLDALLKLMKLTSAIDNGMYNMLWDAVPTIVNAAKEYEKGVKKYVRYPAGNVYQLKLNEPKTLSDAQVNPEIALNQLAVQVNSLNDHDCENYIAVVDQIIVDDNEE